MTRPCTPDDGHSCEPSMADMGQQSPPCFRCGATLLRIEHAPDHRVAGKPCKWPDDWRYCFTRPDRLPTDPFLLPDWKPA